MDVNMQTQKFKTGARVKDTDRLHRALYLTIQRKSGET